MSAQGSEAAVLQALSGFLARTYGLDVAASDPFFRVAAQRPDRRFKVTSTDGERFLFKEVGYYLTDAQMIRHLRLQHQLHQRGARVEEIIPASGGELWVDWNGSRYRLSRWIEGSPPPSDYPHYGADLAILHRKTAETRGEWPAIFGAGRPRPETGRKAYPHGRREWRALLRRFAPESGAEKYLRHAGFRRLGESLEASLGRIDFPALETTVAHGDAHRFNMVQPPGCRPVWVDFEDLRLEHRIVDLLWMGVIHHFFSWTAIAEEVTLRDRPDVDAFGALIEQYDRELGLGAAERQHLGDLVRIYLLAAVDNCMERELLHESFERFRHQVDALVELLTRVDTLEIRAGAGERGKKMPDRKQERTLTGSRPEESGAAPERRPRRKKKPHELHLCSDLASLLAALREKDCDLPSLVREFVKPGVEMGLMVAGSITQGVATGVSDLDVLILLGGMEDLKKGRKREVLGSTVQYLPQEREHELELTLFIDGIEVDLIFVFDRPSEPPASLGDSILNRLTTGWVVEGQEEVERWRERHDTAGFRIRRMTTEFVRAAKNLEDLEAGIGLATGHAALLGVYSITHLIRSLLAYCGFFSTSSKWLLKVDQLVESHPEAAVRDALSAGRSLVFPGLLEDEGEQRAYFEAVCGYCETVRGILAREGQMADVIASVIYDLDLIL